MNEKKSILIVDDEYIIAVDIKQRLESIGYSVTGIANSAHKAIDLCLINTPDIVLMDIIIKGNIDGIEASLMIQKQFNIPVVFISASSDSVTLNKIMSHGSFGYIHKPITDVDLKYTLQQSIQMYAVYKELEVKKKLNASLIDITKQNLKSMTTPAFISDSNNAIVSSSIFFNGKKPKNLPEAIEQLKLQPEEKKSLEKHLSQKYPFPREILLNKEFKCRIIPIDNECLVELYTKI